MIKKTYALLFIFMALIISCSEKTNAINENDKEKLMFIYNECPDRWGKFPVHCIVLADCLSNKDLNKREVCFQEKISFMEKVYYANLAKIKQDTEDFANYCKTKDAQFDCDCLYYFGHGTSKYPMQEYLTSCYEDKKHSRIVPILRNW